MKRTAINLHTITAARLREGRERGSITVEHIMWAVIIVALVTTVGALLTAWATGKIGELG
ncbi:hypothetical protein [uncultured Serinicoccus sp.]|uniref:hypothetical protein n=1 Tax=uncultured Serinicoccus sp. TaxID=735514 RepID=UPI002602136A|nr:hypothetical protein [uncultured Serinicoccus sp.]